MGIKYPVKKKIIVRYPAGASGRFIGCLTQMMLDPTFTFDLDDCGGVHSFEGEQVSDTVFHTHDKMIKCILDNLQTDLSIIQIIATPEYADVVLKNYWIKCIASFDEVKEINRLTKTYGDFVDTEWASEQIYKRYEEMDPRLRSILRQDLFSQSDNLYSHTHPRILNLHSGDVFQGTSVIDNIAEFLSINEFNREPVESMLRLYVKMQPELNRELLESN